MHANSDLGLVSSTKYLGVTIDHCLSFDLSIKNLIKKLSRSVGILAKIKPFLSTAAMLTLFHAIFQSHLQYGVLVWSSTIKFYLRKLIVLQNKTLKIIRGAKWNERASPYYLKFKICLICSSLSLLFLYLSQISDCSLLHLLTISANQIPNTIN